MRRHGVVEFGVAAEVAFDYLVDPRNRPQWQSSLRTVVFPHPDGSLVPEGFGAGTRWIDVTWPGLRPQMETTVAERPTRWEEVGRWHGFDAELGLVFTPTDQGCRVAVEFEVRSPRWLPGVGALLSRAAVGAVVVDLRRANQWASRVRRERR